MSEACPHCGSKETRRRPGALYLECFSCDYAWVEADNARAEASYYDDVLEQGAIRG